MKNYKSLKTNDLTITNLNLRFNPISIDLKKLDFSAGNPVQQINPRNPAMVGDVTNAFESVEE